MNLITKGDWHKALSCIQDSLLPKVDRSSLLRMDVISDGYSMHFQVVRRILDEIYIVKKEGIM